MRFFFDTTDAPTVTEGDLVEFDQGYRTTLFGRLSSEHYDEPYKLRYVVRMDRYTEQSLYRVEAWIGGGWSEVWTLDPRVYPSPKAAPRYEERCLDHIQTVVRKLHSWAESILD